AGRVAAQLAGVKGGQRLFDLGDRVAAQGDDGYAGGLRLPDAVRPLPVMVLEGKDEVGPFGVAQDAHGEVEVARGVLDVAAADAVGEHAARLLEAAGGGANAVDRALGRLAGVLLDVGEDASVARPR